MSKTNARGVAVSASVIAGQVVAKCERDIVGLLLNSTYIPAQHEGKAIDGDYVETWYVAPVPTPMFVRPRPRPLPKP